MKDRIDNKVLKHDDIVSLGRGFDGMKESRFLNCCQNALSARYLT